MNKLLNSFLVFFTVATLFMACDEDPCKNKTCDNGVCDTISGNCLCSNGYQNDATGICTVLWTTKFIGTHNATDSCTGSHPGTTYYTLNITSVSPTVLSLDNLGNYGETLEGIHTNSTNFSINYTTSNGMIFNGTGSLIDTTIVINYILNDSIHGNGLDTCKLTIF